MSAGWPTPKGGPRAGKPNPRHSGAEATPPEGDAAGWQHAVAPAQAGRGGKALVAAAVLVLLVVFVIRNSQRVKVDFIVTSGHPRVIWLIVTCTLLGGAVGFFLGRPSRRSSRHRPGGASQRGDGG